MTLIEIKKKFTDKVFEMGIGFTITVGVIYIQRLDYMSQININRMEDNKTKNELKQTQNEFKTFILNEYKNSVNIIEKNTEIIEYVNLMIKNRN